MRATARRNRADVRIKAMPMRCDARAASRHMGPMISDTVWLESAGKRNFGQLPLILLQLSLFSPPRNPSDFAPAPWGRP